jgi:hypothetical protein
MSIFPWELDFISKIQNRCSVELSVRNVWFLLLLLGGGLWCQEPELGDTTGRMEDFRDRYGRNAIFLQRSFLGGYYYVLGGRPRSTGLFYSRLVRELEPVPEAQALAQRGARWLQAGALSSLIGFSWAFTTLFHDVVYPEDLSRNLPSAIGVGLMSRIVSGYFVRQGQNRLQRAIWIYNRERALAAAPGPSPVTSEPPQEHPPGAPGFSATLVRSDLYLLGYRGWLYSLRWGRWAKAWLEQGLEVAYAELHHQTQTATVLRGHYFYGFHLRSLGKLYPYAVVSAGIGWGPRAWAEAYSGTEVEQQVRMSANLKVGLALEIGAFRLTTETGGGSQGTGHVEVASWALSYAWQPLPPPRYFRDFEITVANQNFVAFTGKYRGDVGGFDFNLLRRDGNRVVNYNAGFFITDYRVNTGVFHGGKEWSVWTSYPGWPFLEVLTGYQLLVWAEPDPDWILPVAVVDLRLRLPVWRFTVFARSRILGTYSPVAGLITGTLASFGIGITL